MYVRVGQSAAEDDGQLGVTDEFDIYEDLQLDALGLVPTSMGLRSEDGEEGAVPEETT